MAKPPKNHGKSWTPSDDKTLKQLASENTPTRVIGLKMGRTPDAVHARVRSRCEPEADEPVALRHEEEVSVLATDDKGGLHRVRAKVGCRNGHLHDLCILVRREVHPDLRCQPEQGAGYVTGGGGCALPPDLDTLAERELRERY